MASHTDLLLGAQWLKAARELGVECQAPYTLTTPDGLRFQFACLLPQFGAERGMLLMTAYDQQAAENASNAGYGYSCLDPRDANSVFSLDGYVDCLKDWGWSADDSEPPDWYLRRE